MEGRSVLFVAFTLALIIGFLSPVSFSMQENLDNNELVKETSILPEAAPSALPQEPWQPYAYNAERIRNPNGSWTVRVYTSPKFFLDPSDNVWRRMRWYETENEYVVIVPYAENGIPARWIIEKSSGTVRAKTWDNLPIIAAQRVEVLILTSERWKQLDENVLGWSTPKVDNGCLRLKLTADLSLDGVRIGSLMLTYRIADTIKYAVRLESAKYSTYRVKWNTMCQGAYYITNEVKGEFKITGEIKSLLWSPFIAVFDPYVRLSFEDISPWRENYFDMSLLKEAIFVKRPEGSAVELAFGDFRLGAGENIELDPSTNFSPTIDTYVRSGTPNTSYNSADRFYVGARQGWGIYRSFLKFNISALPSNITIISANLWVSTYGSYGWPNVQARRVENDNWDGTITWNNQPTFGAVETSFLTDGGWDNYDITAWVDNQVKGDKIVSVCLKHHTENTSDDKSVSYVSSEYNGNDPYLEINYSVPPVTVTLNPIADAFVDSQDDPDGNYGNAYWIGLNLAGSTRPESTWLKFDFSSIPSGATVTEAVFRVYSWRIWYNSSRPGALWDVTTNAWGESTITANNAPWENRGAKISSDVLGPVPGWWEWDVTSWVNAYKGTTRSAWLSNALSVGYSHYGQYYYSKEYSDVAYRPYLEITYVTEAVLSPIADAFTDLRDNPSGNYGFENWIGVNRATKTSGTWPWPSGLGEGTFIKFDISGIPANATVTSATFEAYAYQIWYSTTCDAALRQFGTNWDENTITGMNAPWGTLGGIVSSTVRGSIPGWWTHSVDLSYVQSKLGGQIGFYYCYPGTASGTHYGQFYRSREYGNTNYRPYLKIAYTIPTNNPPSQSNLRTDGQVDPPQITTLTPTFSWTFTDLDGDGQEGVKIQVSTDSTFATITHWDYSDETTTTQSKVYGGSALSRGVWYYVRVQVRDDRGEWSGTWATGEFKVNQLPLTPNRPSGPTSISAGQSGSYTTSTTDPDTDSVKYGWDWNGDGSIDEWTGYYGSGATCSTPHSWYAPGTYYVKVKAQDLRGEESGWSSELEVTVLNDPPTTPSLWGETRPYIGTEYEYSFSSTDPNGHQIRYHIEWGDDTENWTGFYASGEVANASHTWYLQTEFSVRAMAIDEFNMKSGWATLVIRVKTYDDANDTEVGVEWVNEYPDWIGNDLFASDDSAEWFYNILGEDLGWTRVFDWGDGQAWEGDFEKPSVDGWDYIYVDNVDFAFFCGHGSSSAFWFGVDMDGDDSYTYQVHYSEAEWGDKDLEWIVFDACKVLREDNVFTRWSSAFKGLHGMFGFHTIAYQYKRYLPPQEWMDGQRFAEHLRDGKTIGDSWVNATHDIQPSEVWGAAFCILDPTWSPPRWEFWESLPGDGWVGADVWPPLIQESNLLYYYRWQC